MPTAAVPVRFYSVNMAVEDSGLRDKGWKIDVISADHQNKFSDIAANIVAPMVRR